MNSRFSAALGVKGARSHGIHFCQNSSIVMSAICFTPIRGVHVLRAFDDYQRDASEQAPRNVRRVFHNNEWFFSVIDVVAAITETTQPRRYWSQLKTQLSEKEGYSELLGRIEQLKLESQDGKLYATDTVNVETLFRIIQSIPSPKVGPVLLPSKEK